ncbi:MAG TPA: glycosyltransferase [Aquihabitans sp.]|nr:glycosyltransferase [Aquihabitans sp.]
MTEVPQVTVVLPVRDEVARLDRCLGSILAQSWPAECLQVVVVDSGSVDGTADRARELLAGHPEVRSAVVENPGGGRSANLNVGLAHATGAVVCRVDARSIVGPDHVAHCVALLADPARAVVGGRQETLAGGTSAQARGVARALDNRYAMGMARYRRGGPSGWADTVYLGAFRTEQLRAVGGWDEALTVNEDFDLNTRLQRFGGVWYAAELAVGYVARTRVADLARQYEGFGRWKVRYLRSRGARPKVRQVVGLATVPAVLVGVVAAVRLPARQRTVGVAAGLAIALVLEDHGASASAPVPVRLWSLVACAVVVGSWAGGGWAELLGIPDRRRPA